MEREYIELLKIIFQYSAGQEFRSKKTYLLSIFAAHSMFDTQLQGGPAIKYLLHNFLEVLSFRRIHTCYEIVLNISVYRKRNQFKAALCLYISLN